MDIYMDSLNGNDSTGDGTSSNPYQTIAKGITEAAASDNLRFFARATPYPVANDTLYSDANFLGDTWIQDALADKVIFDCLGSKPNWILTDNLYMSDIVIYNWADTTADSFIDTNDTTSSISATVDLERVEMRDISTVSSTGTRGGFIGNGTSLNGENYNDITITLTACIMNNIKTTSASSYTSFIRCAGTVNVNTVNSLWYANSSGSEGIKYFAAKDNSAGNIASISHQNLVIQNEHADTLDLGTALVESTNGGFWTGNINQTDNTTNFTEADPLLADPANNYFEPLPASPLHNGGQPVV